jgi:hypothetical protein
MNSKQFLKLCDRKPDGEQVAEWIEALQRGDYTEASLFNGCLSYRPGSNKQGNNPHQAVFGSGGAMFFLDSLGSRRLLGLWSDRTKKWVVSREVHNYVALDSTSLLGSSGNSMVLSDMSYELSARTQPIDAGELVTLWICESIYDGRSMFSGSPYKRMVARHMALEVLDPSATACPGHWLDRLYPGRDRTQAALSLMRDCTTPEAWLSIVRLYDESGGLPPGTLRDALNLMDRFRSE